MATKLMVIVPDPKAPLLLYVAASGYAVSGVLVHEKEEGGEGHLATRLLCGRGNIRSKAELYRDRKNHICSPNLLKETQALLSGA
jgi:hypothetical protein